MNRAFLGGTVLALLLVSRWGGSCECWRVQEVGGELVPLPGEPPLEADELDRYAAIFRGRAIAVRAAVGRPYGDVEVVFAVRRVWQGPVSSTAIIRTNEYVTACGYEFVLGAEYLVYGDDLEDGGAPQVNSCSRTKLIVFADEEMSLLDHWCTAAEPAPTPP